VRPNTTPKTGTDKKSCDIPEQANTVGLHTFGSGATSSEYNTTYHLIPVSFIKKVADRFALGKIKHGDVNYQKCIKQYRTQGLVELDVEFARDRYNHGMSHFLNLKKTGNHRDDNIGAVGWFLAFASWIEEFGFDWERILNPRYVNEVKFILNSQKELTVITKDAQTYHE
jgi:hypothetical protein